MEWVKAVIQGLVRKRFFGELVLIFEDGRIVRAKKIESLKPDIK